MADIVVRFTGDSRDLDRAFAQAGQSAQTFGQTAQNELNGVDRQAAKTEGSMIRLGDVVGAVAVAQAGRFGWRVLTGELTQFEQAMVSAQIQSQKLSNTLAFAVGRQNVARDTEYLRKTTHDLGLEYASTSQQYARLAASSRGTNMEGQKTKELFEAIAQASAVMGMGVDETEDSLRAVQQMMSKGKVQAEELRGQLGERLPGAFQIAARAMGVTTGELDKMLERGEVYASDFLPRFAAQLKKELAGAVEEASNSAQAASNRFANAWEELKRALADSGVYDAVAARQAKVADGFKRMSESLRENKAAGEGTFVSLTDATATWVRSSGTYFGTYLGAVDRTTQAVQGFFGVASGNLAQSKAALVEARQKLVELQAQSDVMGKNIYWQDQKARVEAHIADLERVIRLRSRIDLADNTGGETRLITRRDQDARTAAADRASLNNITQGLSGQGENYQRHLAELYRLRQAGTIDNDKEYVRLVQELIKKEGGIKKPEHKANPADAVFRQISERTSELRVEADQQQNLTAAQKLAVKTLDDLRTGALKLTPVEKARMGQQLEQLLIEDNVNTARDKAIKLQQANAAIVKKNEEAAERLAESRLRSLEAEIQHNDKLREEIALLGLNDNQRAAHLVALEDEAIARAKIDLVTASNIEGNDAEIARLEREINLRQQRKQLLVEKGEKETAKKLAEEHKKTADQITDSITQSLMRGGRGFLDMLRDESKKLVLTPIVKAIVQPLGDIGASLLGGGLSGGGSGGNGGLLGGLNSLSSIGSMFGAGGLGGSVAAGAGWMTGASTLSGTLSAASSLVGTGTAAGTAAGLGMFAGALGPFAIGASLLSSLATGGETRSGGQYYNGALVAGPSGGTLGNGSEQIAAVVKAINEGVGLGGGVARVSEIVAGLESSKNGKGFAYGGVRLNNGVTAGQGFDGLGYNNRRGSMSTEEAQRAFAEELDQVFLQGLQSSDIKGAVRAYLDSLGNIDELQGAKLTAAVANAKTALALQDQLTQLQSTDAQNRARDRQRQLEALQEPALQDLQRQVYAAEDGKRIKELQLQLLDAQSTAEEVLARKRKEELAALDATSAAIQAQIYIAQDAAAAIKALGDAQRQMLVDRVTTSRDVLQQAYDRESSALKQAAESHRDYAKSLKEAAEQLAISDLNPKPFEVITQTALKQFNAASAKASAGIDQTDEKAVKAQNEARQKVISLAPAVLQASLASSKTSVEYAAAYARMQTTLALAAAKATATATLEDSQLAALKDSVRGILTLDGNIISVREAIERLHADIIAGIKGGAAVSTIKAATGSNLPQEQWNKTAFGDVYASSGGAIGVRDASGAVTIHTLDGKAISAAQVLTEAAAAIGAGNYAGLKAAQLRTGISDESLSAILAGSGISIDGSHKDGLDYVPRDGYLAQLHAGERVKTASQARDEDAMAAQLREITRVLGRAEMVLQSIADHALRTRKGTEELVDRGVRINNTDNGSAIVVAMV